MLYCTIEKYNVEVMGKYNNEIYVEYCIFYIEVDLSGVEPLISAMRMQRITNCATGPSSRPSRGSGRADRKRICSGLARQDQILVFEDSKLALIVCTLYQIYRKRGYLCFSPKKETLLQESLRVSFFRQT
jgi:hypothetical protein